MDEHLLKKILYQLSGKSNAELISIHLPKTGGRSFYEILRLIYGSKVDPRTKREDFFPEYNRNKQIQLVNGISIIHGHFYFQEIQHLVGRNTKLITWMRDPVDRVISNYYFLIYRIHTGRVKPEQMDKAGYSLIEYARLESQRNVMNRFLKGVNLNDFYFIGDFQEYTKEMKILLEMLKHRTKIPEIHENKTQDLGIYKYCTTKPESITEAMKQEIKDLNHEDNHLFNKMLELKSKRINLESNLNKHIEFSG